MTTTTNTITNKIIKEIEENSIWNEKYGRQEELELKMRTMGVDRFWKNDLQSHSNNQSTKTAPVKRLLHYSIGQIEEGIKNWLVEVESGTAGRKHSAYPYIKQLEPEVLAVMTARVVLDGITEQAPLVRLARGVAGLIVDELTFRVFKEEDKEHFNKVVAREHKQHGGRYHLQRLVVRYNMGKRGFEQVDWDVRTQVLVGSKLIEIMVETTGLVKLHTISRDKRQELVLEATAETMEWLEEEACRCSVLTPVYLPTIIPPKPWTTPFDGGYWTPRLNRVRMIKTRGNGRAYLDELSEHDMPEVYDAINAMQHTAWRVNTKLLDTARMIWGLGGKLGGVPSADPYELPQRPMFMIDELPKEEWTEEQWETFKEWKRATADTHTKNVKLKSLRLQFVKILTTAEMFEDEEEIYFPHQFDFRGRAYAVPLFLNPQGSDFAKGLLQFANGMPIETDEAEQWLAIHGANSFGVDKVSLEDRVQWVMDNDEAICLAGYDPLVNTFWAESDDPWQSLAFCIEWSEYRKNGRGYVSHLPVQMDGSCNGLQNFSAMLRDAVGGAAVNLLPTDKPADIYQEVANVVLEQVTKDATSDDPKTAALAQGWLKHGITRKVCKRPVMTLAYGAKQYGFQTQVFDDTVRPLEVDEGVTYWESGWDASLYLGQVIWNSVGKVVIAARAAMDWLQKAARAASAEGLPVRWETPDGLVVVQSYNKMETKRIDMTFNKIRISPTIATQPTTKIDKPKQSNGISPNWVHSMDASHMRETVRMCWGAGVEHFSLIHDSYGTHAANAGVLAEKLREAFIKMYSEDVLEKFKRELELQLSDDVELDELPSKGTLDLEAVRQSRYFFA